MTTHDCMNDRSWELSKVYQKSKWEQRAHECGKYFIKKKIKRIQINENEYYSGWNLS